MASAIFISTILPPMAAKAMAIGRYIADKAVDKAVDKPMDKAMDMVFDKVDGIVNIDGDIFNLQKTLCMIEGTVRVAEVKQIDNVFIRNWLRDLVDIAYKARDVLDDFITFSSCIIKAEEASNPVNFISSFMPSYFGGSSSDTSNIPLTVLNRLEKDIKSVTERFDKKKKEGDTFETLKDSESVRVERRPIVGPSINKHSDALFLGREEVKKKIMEKILRPSDDRVHVVVIWGMGGIGKTTLAQSIYNDYPTENRKWLCVGENKFSTEKVIKEILNDQNTIGIGNLDAKLRKELSIDRFLIVLDDVWDVGRSEWDSLFNPLTNVGKGGLVIITTRKSEVCAAINTQPTYHLLPLSEEDSWSLFESCAYVNGKFESTLDLKCIGMKIVKKLNGLPLALKVVGCSLLNKDSSIWTNFLESNKFSKHDEVMSALRWSYNHLPPHLKMCFTYCALFPKDHVLDKKVLVQMWMAHDLIEKDEQERPEDVGAQYFEELVNASLFQCVDGKHVMHDLIHDLALLVSNGEFATVNGSLTDDQMKNVRHVTITPDGYWKIPRLCKIEKLLTLYATKRFNYFAPDDVFKQLKSIRVLVLTSYFIKEIPGCISELRHLRYLDVSKTDVKRLPDSLCRLYNLQMIAAARDADLPRDIVKMVNLRYIRASLSTCKGVGKLTSLQELSSIHVCEGDNIRELGDMQRLRGKLRIKGLENVTSSEDAAGALMEKQTLLDKLKLEFDKKAVEPTISAQVLDALGRPPNLTDLRIAGYTGVKPPSWMVDGKHEFDKLQTLQLYFCTELESLPPLGELTSLKHLYLWNVGVKRLGDEFYGKFTDGKVFFPSLESLEFSLMRELEEWDGTIIENSSVSFFPRLTTLKLSNFPKLESLPPLGELTSLKDLYLKSVGVKRLGDEFYGKFTDGKVFFPSLERLEFIEMEKWEEWNGIIIENSSVSFFPRLTTLKLLNFPKLESLPPLGELTSLKHLYLWNVGVKRLGDEFYGKFTDGKVFFPSLESLEFSLMRELEEWDGTIIENSSVSFFPRLTTLKLSNFPKLESFPPFGELTSLKDLYLQNVGVKRLGDEFYGKFTDGKVFFPSLESLSFYHMEEWEEWDGIIIENSSVSFFPRLTRLTLSNFPTLESLPPLGELTSLKHFCLSNVGVKRLGDEFYGKFTDGKVFFPSLESLEFSLMRELEEWDGTIIENSSVSFFPRLTTLKLSNFPKLESLPPLGELTSLKHLHLSNVGVKRLGDEFYGKFTDGKVFFPSLESLSFYHMEEWEEWDGIIIENSSMSVFPRLTTLNLSNCPKLESLPPLGELTSLKEFGLWNVGVKRLGDEFYGKFTDGKVFFPSLESLSFSYMKEWEEWDGTIIENSNVSFFPRLTRLKLSFCHKLESLPPLEELTSLKDLYLQNVGVKRLGDEFYGKFTDGKVFFPSLERLEFIEMEKWEEWNGIIIENSSVSFFPRLTTLKLLNFPKLESLPPLGELTSLKHLHLSNVGVKRLGDEFYGKFTDGKVFFPYLESLSFYHMEEWEEWDGIIIENSSVSFFPRLTRLVIQNCLQIQSLPADGLPPSLRYLEIKDCPLLYERCEDESGLDWYKINHIRERDIRPEDSYFFM